MGPHVARQRAAVCGSAVRDGLCAVGGHNVDVKIDHALAADGAVYTGHAMRRMASGTTEARIYVQCVLNEACVGYDPSQIVAFPAERVRAIHAEVRRWKKVGD